MDNNLTLLISLISLGFIGGFSHCVGMCSPFVFAQIGNNLNKISLEKFTKFEKLKNLALLPYHLGRITTYSIIGFFCSFFAQNLINFSGFRFLSAGLLIICALFFLTLFFNKNFSFFRLNFSVKFSNFFAKKLNYFLKNPKGLNGYFLGLILGFIPCSLLYGAFLIAANISNAFLAMLGMFLFGCATFPALFLSALGANFLIKYSGFKIFTKLIILTNAILLFLMALKLIF
jgi:sulfite exporter TauE/SafE